MTTPINIPDYYAGDTLSMEFKVRDKQGRPINMVNAFARFGIAPKVGRTIGDPVVTLTSNDEDVTFGDPTTLGVINVVMPSATLTQTGEYVMELEVTLNSGESLTVAHGNLTCLPAVLKDDG